MTPVNAACAVGILLVVLSINDRLRTILPWHEMGRNINQHSSKEAVNDRTLIVGLALPIILVVCLFMCAVRRAAQSARVPYGKLTQSVSMQSLRKKGAVLVESIRLSGAEPKLAILRGFTGNFGLRVLLPDLDAKSPPHGASRNDRSHIALVCTHPWAVFGGNMLNNVPRRLAELFASRGFTSATFDFRGCGISRGTGEVADTVKVARYLRARKGAKRITTVIAVGYSYGSMIGEFILFTVTSSCESC